MARATRHVALLAATVGLLTPSLASAQAKERAAEVSQRAGLGHVVVAPTFSANIGFSKRYRASAPDVFQEGLHLSLWGGLAVHPWAGDHSLYGAVGVEVEPHDLPNGVDMTYVMPMAHLGYAWLGCHDEVNVLSATFACAKLYTMFGLRPNPFEALPSARLGLGFNSFFVTLAGLHGNALLPSTFETILELDPTGRRVLMFRMGLGF